jgi:hypothetical protein
MIIKTFAAVVYLSENMDCGLVFDSLLTTDRKGKSQIHIFGTSGNDRCTPKLVSTWLSLLVLLASSDEVTGQSIASSFTKGCGGCMVYTILMAVACYPSEVITQLAFDFFRHVLADPKGEMLELHEVTAISSLLNQHVPYRQDGTMMRTACLELSVIGDRVDSTTIKGQTIHALRDFIEGLGTLCTSKTFVIAMKENSISTIQIIKESIMNKTFSRKFVEKKWS